MQVRERRDRDAAYSRALCAIASGAKIRKAVF
ncbi:hypothetical protein C5S31_07890 [ANME-1 cluster archaeon GoMg2]|nr:hypothetical protein [ANME-1 cluster archaeon GoMg2]